MGFAGMMVLLEASGGLLAECLYPDGLAVRVRAADRCHALLDRLPAPERL